MLVNIEDPSLDDPTSMKGDIDGGRVRVKESKEGLTCHV